MSAPEFESTPSVSAPLAWLQLVRIPNVFTAMADVLLGYLLTHQSLEPWPVFASLLASSMLLYLAGMVLNDYYDRDIDARDRPGRPIPSGRVTPSAAKRLGYSLLGLGRGAWSACRLSGGRLAAGLGRLAAGSCSRTL